MLGLFALKKGINGEEKEAKVGKAAVARKQYWTPSVSLPSRANATGITGRSNIIR
jgi:hypothetical protein